MILDHIGLAVRDFARSSTFFRRSLAPLGIQTVLEGEGWAMLGKDGRPEFWIGVHGIPPGPIHLAFAAESYERVEGFHREGLAAGGIDNGAPGPRPKYSPGYHGAFLLDPDGHNVEAVWHAPEG